MKQLDALTPHRRASNAMVATSTNLQHRLRVRARYRKVVETWFSTRARSAAGGSSPPLLVSIATLVDWEMWQSLRTYPTRSIVEAKACLGLLLSAALRQIEAEAAGALTKRLFKRAYPAFGRGREAAPQNRDRQIKTE